MLIFNLLYDILHDVENKSTKIKKGGVFVTDTLKLVMAIKKAGLTQNEVAKRLGLSVMGFYQKMNNITEFKASEIAELYNLLSLQSLEEQQQIFFN